MANAGRRGGRQKRGEKRKEIREKVREKLVAALSEEPEQPGRARLRKARLSRLQQRLAFKKEWLESRRKQLNELEQTLSSITFKSKPKKPTKKNTAA